jgi:crotonobetainyl-CoA:carnitine CoA-transferase CaiB-like acyl-CoA transferase
MLGNLIGEVLAAKPVSHWAPVFDRHDIANDPVQNPEQVLQDPQAAALGQLVEVALRGEEAALIPRLPVELSLNPPSVLGPPPAAGEHSRAILCEAGYNETDIEDLVRAGAVGA